MSKTWKQSEEWRDFFTIADELRERMLMASDVTVPENPYLSLTISQARACRAVVSLLPAHPEGVGLKLLADKLKVSAAAASEMVEVLVRKGVLQRQQSSVDRRAVCITLSDRARRQVAQVENFVSRQWTELLSTFSEAEQETWSRLVTRLKNRILEGE